MDLNDPKGLKPKWLTKTRSAFGAEFNSPRIPPGFIGSKCFSAESKAALSGSTNSIFSMDLEKDFFE